MTTEVIDGSPCGCLARVDRAQVDDVTPLRVLPLRADVDDQRVLNRG